MFYKYKITYWDTFETLEKIERGIVHGTDYGAAANKLVEVYGKDCIIDLYLQELEGESVIFEDELQDLFK